VVSFQPAVIAASALFTFPDLNHGCGFLSVLTI